MRAFARKRLAALRALGLCGYVLKRGSPSCGLDRVKIYPPRGRTRREGRGLFAVAVLEALPRIPVEEEGRLADPALRGVAVGRKNHYGSRSERGTLVAALFYSLIESAKLADVEPRAYLGEAARRAIRSPQTVTLPCDLK